MPDNPPKRDLNLMASMSSLKKLSSIHKVTKFTVILERLVEIFSKNLDRFPDPLVDWLGNLNSKNLVHLCFSYKLVVPLNPSWNRITAPHLRNKT